ncbi:unnamed protein product [Danaus chrysippus]|uniref:(African queen) hypothetical protein n=1 Tax=Danaus chrysippus TaxID=151541 RepID=A0A8J2VQV9_9NEOP|nr:unnamed protein product [Danaus chrysippus]
MTRTQPGRFHSNTLMTMVSTLYVDQSSLITFTNRKGPEYSPSEHFSHVAGPAAADFLLHDWNNRRLHHILLLESEITFTCDIHARQMTPSHPMVPLKLSQISKERLHCDIATAVTQYITVLNRVHSHGNIQIRYTVMNELKKRSRTCN